jgi:hypothetical protein
MKDKKKQLYPKNEDKDTIQKLKARIRRLTKERDNYKGQVRTLQRAFDKSIEFIQERFRNKSIKEIIEMLNEE